MGGNVLGMKQKYNLPLPLSRTCNLFRMISIWVTFYPLVPWHWQSVSLVLNVLGWMLLRGQMGIVVLTWILFNSWSLALGVWGFSLLWSFKEISCKMSKNRRVFLKPFGCLCLVFHLTELFLILSEIVLLKLCQLDSFQSSVPSRYFML